MENHKAHPEHLPLIGWREKVALPDLGVRRLLAKIDTGARTSSLHAFDVRPFQRDGVPWVRFGVHPLRRREDVDVRCEAEAVGQREVVNSGGHRQRRWVVRTRLQLGDTEWIIELNLNDRSTLGYRMLLGRTALRGRYQIDPSRSFLRGEPRRLEPK
jgi:hypothetical protein